MQCCLFSIWTYKKCGRIKDTFPELSKFLSFNLILISRTSDFPNPGILKKKIQDLPGGVGIL